MSHNPLKGTIIVISDYGIGKTVFSLGSSEKLSNVIFLADDKEPPVDPKEFQLYFNLSAELQGLTQLEIHDKCLALIDKLPEAEVIIWDTWTRFSKTFIEYVLANPKQFRDRYRGDGAMIGAAKWNDAFDYEAGIINKLKAKCKRLILTFHIKQAYDSNGVAIPSKMKPGHNRAVTRIADLRLWLTPNPESQIPIGLVLKNIAKFSNGRFQQVLPLRLDKCDWTNILRYYDKPIGDRLPNATEKPTEFELSLIEGFLTEEQKKLYEIALEVAVDKSKDNPDQEIIDRAKELTGLPGRIAATLSEEFTQDITIEQVIEWRNGSE